jgi:hypothetical protein
MFKLKSVVNFPQGEFPTIFISKNYSPKLAIRLSVKAPGYVRGM